MSNQPAQTLCPKSTPTQRRETTKTFPTPREVPTSNARRRLQVLLPHSVILLRSSLQVPGRDRLRPHLLRPITEFLRKNKLLGTGKVQAVMLASTRELALQITAELERLKHHPNEYTIVTVYGGGGA